MTTALLKEAILRAAEARGRDGAGKDGLAGYCEFLAAEEPRAFATLLGKVLPLQIATADDVPLVPIINLSIGPAPDSATEH